MMNMKYEIECYQNKMRKIRIKKPLKRLIIMKLKLKIELLDIIKSRKTQHSKRSAGVI